MSAPSVIYKIIDNKNQELLIRSTTDWPRDFSQIKETQEPWIRLELMTPLNFVGKIMEILQGIEAKYKEKNYFGQDKALLIYEAPLREIIVGFYDNILEATQGYASLNYKILGFEPADLVKLEILIAGRKEEAFSKIVSKGKVYQEGSKLVKKLKEILPPQQFSVALQATVSGKIIARETIKARGKDVIAPLYGGDYTRKRKLLERQKKGKKELKENSKIRIPTNVFFEILKK
jgi:GTP-binding protein LepA